MSDKLCHCELSEIKSIECIIANERSNLSVICSQQSIFDYHALSALRLIMTQRELDATLVLQNSLAMTPFWQLQCKFTL